MKKMNDGLKSHLTTADFFVNQMLKGVKGVPPPEYQGKKNEAKRQELCEKLRQDVSLFVPYIPARANAAIGAVVCKAAIKYGLKKALAFARAVNEGIFKGYNDPAHLLWLYLVRNKNSKSRTLYAITVTAARAYCEGRELKHLRESETDIFDWSDDLIEPLRRLAKEITMMKIESSVPETPSEGA